MIVELRSFGFSSHVVIKCPNDARRNGEVGPQRKDDSAPLQLLRTLTISCPEQQKVVFWALSLEVNLLRKGDSEVLDKVRFSMAQVRALGDT